MSGKHYADDSMTPAPIEVSRDKYMNEIPTDRPSHENTTAGEGAFGWGEKHYADDFSSYGSGVEDRGKSPVTERTAVDAGRANRGQDS